MRPFFYRKYKTLNVADFFLHLNISKLKEFSWQIFSRHCHNKFGRDQGKSQFQCTKFENVIIAGHSNVAAWKTEQL